MPSVPSSPAFSHGTLQMWNDEKGFGFIEPRDGGADVFLHISAFEDRNIRPTIGALIAYRRGSDDEGRPRALNARLAGIATGSGPTFAPIGDRRPPPQPPKRNPTRSRRPAAPNGSSPKLQATLGAAAFLGALTASAWWEAIPAWVPTAYFAASFVTFLVYFWDKTSAEAGDRRIAENTLHLLEALGGWPGALVAQHCLRHKTGKVAYQVIFWLLTAAHLGFWVWLALAAF